MDANIESIVNDLNKVQVEAVTFEAINNAIQAGASEIEVYFYEKNSSFEEVQEYHMVDHIKIIDNGIGFTEENIASFKIYRSPYKKELGAKGIGRFLYLKLFKNIEIKSLLKKINFTVKTDVDVQDINEHQKNTVVLFSKPRGTYQINKKNYKQLVENSFLPQFHLLNQDKKDIKIKVFFNDVEEYMINSLNAPRFNTKLFNIKGYDFTLNYLLNDNNIDLNDGFYCAGKRIVAKNSGLDAKIKFKSFQGVKLLFLLESKYFDNNVNDERDEFNIKPAQTNLDLYRNLSWTDIQESLSENIKEICLTNGIDIEKEAKFNLDNSLTKAPFLAHYLSTNEYGLSSDELIKKAKKDYDKEKEFLRDSKNQSEVCYKLTLHRVVQSELAEYVFDREKIINKLRSIVDNELLEKEVHNLFMKQGTKDNTQDHRTNNLWLFDDRFMAYDKIFSEVQIKTIFPELSDISKRLDLCIISNTYEKEAIVDIVIIELKRPDENITPARAEEQLLEYARYINSSRQENKIRIWTYAFLKFTSDAEESLKDKTYNYIPTQSQYPIYYRYYERANIIINFMDYAALADDAHTRNQTFINILKGKQFDKIKAKNI